jgi:hypothetical protein
MFTNFLALPYLALHYPVALQTFFTGLAWLDIHGSILRKVQGQKANEG